MTTPAVNINDILKRPYDYCFRNYSGTSPSGGYTCTTYTPGQSYYYRVRSRPQSGTSAFTGKRGWRPCRAWNHSGQEYKLLGGVNRLVVQYPTYGTEHRYSDSSFWGTFSPPALPAFPSGVVNRAEQAALLKLKDQDFHLGQFLAEYEKTELMVANRIVQIARQVQRFRKRFPRLWRDVRRFEIGSCDRRIIKKIPKLWLELQYGWNPLMADVLGFLHHLSKDGPGPLVSVKGYSKDYFDTSVTVNSVMGSSKCVLGVNGTHEAWVRLYYQLTNPGLAEISSLGLANPLEIVWELIPYSFVVDWFFPVGNWLSSQTADLGFTFQGGSLSKLSKQGDVVTRSVSLQNVIGNPSVVASGPGVQASGNAFNFTRSCYTASPSPGFYLKNPLSAVHVANALALLAVAFERRS